MKRFPTFLKGPSTWPWSTRGLGAVVGSLPYRLLPISSWGLTTVFSGPCSGILKEPRLFTSPSAGISSRAFPTRFTEEKFSLLWPLTFLSASRWILWALAVQDPTKLALPQPYVQGGFLYGQIIRVDNFGNLITNISARELTGFLETSSPRIEVGKLVIRKLNRIYADCEEGEPLALINSSNLMEIAVNLGRASEYMGLRNEEIVGALVRVGKG